MTNDNTYLDQDGVLALTKSIFEEVNTRIDIKVNDVQNAINTLKSFKYNAITGDIDILVPLDARRSNVIYLQRDNDQTSTWNRYIWDADNSRFVPLGTMELVLTNYWSKSKEDIAEMKELLGINAIYKALEDR